MCHHSIFWSDLTIIFHSQRFGQNAFFTPNTVTPLMGPFLNTHSRVTDMWPSPISFPGLKRIFTGLYFLAEQHNCHLSIIYHKIFLTLHLGSLYFIAILFYFFSYILRIYTFTPHLGPTIISSDSNYIASMLFFHVTLKFYLLSRHVIWHLSILRNIKRFRH